MRTEYLNRHRLGLILILIGLTAWLPYGVFKYGLDRDVAVYPFLAWHLAGGIPGFLLRRGDLLWR
ncbi:MAG: hypothetical protein EXR53_00520 [Dehalococcoidia bacterium]|nr:hypothetical protein [Dehalococcoidia bacterium]